MKVLLTGGTGLLGRALLDHAPDRRWTLHATHLSQPPASTPHAQWHRLDVRDPSAVDALFEAVRPDAVIHTAYRMGGDALVPVTLDGTRHVTLAAKRAGARLVHLSTDVLFDGLRVGPYTEDDPRSPITDYGRAKADAEAFVLAEHPDAVAVRTSLLYSLAPDDRQARLALDLARGVARGALFTDELRCPARVDEVAVALGELVAHTYRGVLHVAGDETLSRHTFGALLVALHGGDPAALPGARSADQPVLRPRNCALAVDRMKAVLAARVRGAETVLREAIRRT